MPGHPPALVLASGSPRRRELLERAGIAFEIWPADLQEKRIEGESPDAMVERLAREKALAVARSLPASPARWVLGADTTVVVGEQVLGKPDDPEHAVALLGRIVGRAHTVLTGVALCTAGGDRWTTRVVASRVHMRAATEAELRSYVATGEPLDKAGAYALQGEGRRFVTRVEGSESNVIGLPMEETRDLLAEVGIAADPA
jgi:septum formation protein